MNEIIERIGLLPREQVFAWREAHRTGSDEPLSLRWETSPMWTPEHREAVAKALSDWALEQSDAREVLQTIARADRRVGVWLACASARTALRYVPADDESPRLAIETAERWVRGEECRAAVSSAAARAAAYVDAGRAACAAANAARAAANAAFADCAAAAYAAAARSAAADASDAARAAAANVYAASWSAALTRSLRNLRQTIASATRDAIDAAAEGYERSQLATRDRQHKSIKEM